MMTYTLIYINTIFALVMPVILIAVILCYIYARFKNIKKILSTYEQTIDYQNKTLLEHVNILENQNKILHKYQMMTSKTINGLALIDSNLKIELINNSLLNIFGITEQNPNIIGKNVEVILNQETINIIKNCFCDAQNKTFEATINNNTFQIHIAPIIDEVDNTEHIITIFSNINKLKIAEKENLEQKNELQKQKESLINTNQILESYVWELEKLSLVAQQTDNSIFITDYQGNIIWVNQAFERHSGYQIDQYLKQFGNTIFKASASPDISNAFNKVITQKKSVQYSFKTKTSKGDTIWLSTTLTPTFDSYHNVKNVIAICSDITKIKLQEEMIENQNQEITNSIEYAKRIQDALKPMKIFTETLLDNYFIINLPRDIVSGDFYWVDYKDNKIIFAVGDCTGHGIPGAFMSILGMSILKNIINQATIIQSNYILDNLRLGIIKTLHQHGKEGETQDGIDLSLCILDSQNMTLDYCGAYGYGYLIKKEENNNQIIRLKNNRMPIGIHQRDNIPFINYTYQLQKDDQIFLLSDGFLDQFGGLENKKFYAKNWEKLLQDICNKNINQQKEEILQTFQSYKGENPQLDDILIFSVKI